MYRTGIPRPLDIAAIMRKARAVSKQTAAAREKRMPIPLISNDRTSVSVPPKFAGPPPAQGREQGSSVTLPSAGVPRSTSSRSDLPLLPVPEAKRAKASGCVARQITEDKTLLDAAMLGLSERFLRQ